MELQYGKFPNFYKNYKWIVEKENSRSYFCGRKNYLENFWLELCNVAEKGASRTNRTFIGQRKLGKTAYLLFQSGNIFSENEIKKIWSVIQRIEKKLEAH